MRTFVPVSPHRSAARGSRRASALVIVLICVVLVTLLVVTLLVVTQHERVSARLALSKAASECLADYAADAAMARIRQATEAGMSPGRLWISEPGRIRVYDGNNLNAPLDYELFSGLPGADGAIRDERNVDLNRRSADGNFPIAPPAPGKNAAQMKVGWINLLANPDAAASAANPIVGRIAYWVDDESCKVNVNTADGSAKNETIQTQIAENHFSYGFGTPSEVSLQALPDGQGNALTRLQAQAISRHAWERGFNSIDEIRHAGANPGIPENFTATNRFNLTHSSKSPDLTFFGEPRLALFPVFDMLDAASQTSGGVRRSGNLGGYNPINRLDASGPIDFIYPLPAQLPPMRVTRAGGREPTIPPSPFDGTPDRTEPLQLYPQFWTQLYNTNLTIGATTITAQNRRPNVLISGNTKIIAHQSYPFLSRIARALQGYDSRGNEFVWPNFTGDGTKGFGAKYNARQLDAMALTIYDMTAIASVANQNLGYTYPTFTIFGMLSNAPVTGIGRAPRLTEIYTSIDSIKGDVTYGGTTTPNVPQVQVETRIEFLFPEGFAGTTGQTNRLEIGMETPHPDRVLNQPDYNTAGAGTLPRVANTPGVLGGYWADNLLSFVNAANPANSAGIDLKAHSFEDDDPETARSALHHPYAGGKGGSDFGNQRVHDFYTIMGFGALDTTTASWVPGDYRSLRNRGYGISLYGDPNVSTFQLTGGLSLVTSDSGSAGCWEMVPLDAAFSPELIYASTYPASPPKLTAKDNVEKIKKAVIPVPQNFTFSTQSFDNAWNSYVVDPLVNKFPGDWITRKDDTQFSMGGLGITNGYSNLHNPGYAGNDGGDPLSIWLPRQDTRYPKQSRFPSVGALNYVRTGVIPDDLSVDLTEQRGTPWRTVNLSASTDPSQEVSANYPDWVMLDFFTVPFTPQAPYTLGGTAVPTPKRLLTFGGATEGKINLNNPRIPHPFDQTLPQVEQTPPERSAPLEALFLNVPIQSYDSDGKVVTKILDAAEAKTLADAVQQHLKTQSFLLPGQLADVEAIDAFTFRGVPAKSVSRNDLLRQVTGATTTQSNVFSIWVVTQTIQKNPKNTDFGVYQKGDAITSETRRRYLVERVIETGRDGVPGNAIAPGADGVVGTEDDALDADYHPALTYPLPYKWRVIAIENITS